MENIWLTYGLRLESEYVLAKWYVHDNIIIFVKTNEIVKINM